MEYKYKVGQKVLTKDYIDSYREAVELALKGVDIYVDSEDDGDIFLISKSDIERIPKTLTVSGLSSHASVPSYAFRETQWWLYEFMISPINKYLVSFEDK